MNQFSSSDMLAMLRSPAGRQLLSLFQQQDPQTLEKAKALAQSGNYADLKNVMGSLLSDPEVLRLLRQLGGGKLE